MSSIYIRAEGGKFFSLFNITEYSDARLTHCSQCQIVIYLVAF